MASSSTKSHPLSVSSPLVDPYAGWKVWHSVLVYDMQLLSLRANIIFADERKLPTTQGTSICLAKRTAVEEEW